MNTVIGNTQYDVGLRNHMVGIYNNMMMGLLLSTIAALVVLYTPLGALFVLGKKLTILGFIAALAPLGIMVYLMFKINDVGSSSLNYLYWTMTVLMGIGLAPVFLVYTSASIINALLTSTLMFGAMSLWGYTTSKDLSGWGNFLLMGLFGLIIASLINVFLASSAMAFAISLIAVLVFAAFTAYDTQELKNLYYASMSSEDMKKAQILGSLNLYLNFVNLFVYILQLMGVKSD